MLFGHQMKPLTLTLMLQIPRIQGTTFYTLIPTNGAKQVQKISFCLAVKSHFCAGSSSAADSSSRFRTKWHQHFWWRRAATSELFLQPQQMQRRLCKSALMAGFSELPAAETRAGSSRVQMWTRETVCRFSWKWSSALQHKLCDVIPVRRAESCFTFGGGGASVGVWGGGDHNQLTEGDSC